MGVSGTGQGGGRQGPGEPERNQRTQFKELTSWPLEKRRLDLTRQQHSVQHRRPWRHQTGEGSEKRSHSLQGGVCRSKAGLEKSRQFLSRTNKRSPYGPASVLLGLCPRRVEVCQCEDPCALFTAAPRVTTPRRNHMSPTGEWITSVYTQPRNTTQQ